MSPRSPRRPHAAAPARIAALAEALSAGRIDVLLEPIVGLEDEQARHYEVTIRLRGSAGDALDCESNATEIRGTGLLPLFDCARMARTANLARRLEERGKGGSVFSAYSSESLTDDRFLGSMAEQIHQRSVIAAQLVLTFAQSDVRGFAAPEWESLADMREFGFRFALSSVTDLGMDFEALVKAGFAFVKLDADVFLDGLPAPGGAAVPANDICRHLARLGLTLVVERIDDEAKRARIFGFGALFGQGQLFGGKRPVKAAASGASHAAA